MAKERMTDKQKALLSFINRINDEIKQQLNHFGGKKSNEYIQAEKDFNAMKFSLVLSIAGVDMSPQSVGIMKKFLNPHYSKYELRKEQDSEEYKHNYTLRKKYHRRLNLLSKKGFIKIIKKGHFYNDIQITSKGYMILNVES